MKRIIILSTVLIFMAISIAYAIQSITDSSTMAKFARVVRINGYSCNDCVQADFFGNKHKGKEFRVICDYERNAFRVTLTSTGFDVEPW